MTGLYLRRSYPATPIPPVLYGAWVAVLERAGRNEGYAGHDDEPILLNEGTRFETPFTVELCLAWAERLAK